MRVSLDLSGTPTLTILYEFTKIIASFKHTLTLCRPAAYHTDSYKIHKDSWWILFDNAYESASELRFSETELGFYVSYHSKESECGMYISERDTLNLLLLIENALLDAGFESIKKEPVRLLKPTGLAINYKVYPIVCKVERVSSFLVNHVNAKLSIPMLITKRSKCERPVLVRR